MKVFAWIIGSLVIIIILIFLSSKIGNLLFDRKVKVEVRELFSGIKEEIPEVVTEKDIAGLPGPVKNWLINSGIIGREKISSVRLKQKGQFRLGREGSWMPFEAKQYYITEVPGFIWHTDMRLAPLVSIKGRDIYFDGKGNMLIKIMSLIKVADASGPEIDQADLVRYLNEIMWFPTAALNHYIEWEPIDDSSARAIIEYGGVKASAVFYFSSSGEIINFVADRYADRNGSFTLEEWHTPIKEHKELNGIKIPVKGDGVWKFESGDFTYIKIEIIDIEYNNPGIY